jgi:hypothetical protein
MSPPENLDTDESCALHQPGGMSNWLLNYGWSMSTMQLRIERTDIGASLYR